MRFHPKLFSPEGKKSSQKQLIFLVSKLTVKRNSLSVPSTDYLRPLLNKHTSSLTHTFSPFHTYSPFHFHTAVQELPFTAPGFVILFHLLPLLFCCPLRPECVFCQQAHINYSKHTIFTHTTGLSVLFIHNPVLAVKAVLFQLLSSSFSRHSRAALTSLLI